MSVIIGGMLILGGIGIIGVVSYAIYQGSKMTFRDPRKNERREDTNPQFQKNEGGMNLGVVSNPQVKKARGNL